MPSDDRHWGICDNPQARHRRRQPERMPIPQYVLQMAFEETIPVVKEARVELNLGQRDLKIWMLVADITDEFIMRPAGLRRVSGRGAPCAATELRTGASEKRDHRPSVNAAATESRRNGQPVRW
jgi:hypothetical protein